MKATSWRARLRVRFPIRVRARVRSEHAETSCDRPRSKNYEARNASQVPSKTDTRVGSEKHAKKKEGRRKKVPRKTQPRRHFRRIALSFRRKWQPEQTLTEPNKKDHAKRWSTPTGALRTSQNRIKSGHRALLFLYPTPLRPDRALKRGHAPSFF